MGRYWRWAVDTAVDLQLLGQLVAVPHLVLETESSEDLKTSLKIHHSSVTVYYYHCRSWFLHSGRSFIQNGKTGNSTTKFRSGTYVYPACCKNVKNSKWQNPHRACHKPVKMVPDFEHAVTIIYGHYVGWHFNYMCNTIIFCLHWWFENKHVQNAIWWDSLGRCILSVFTTC